MKKILFVASEGVPFIKTGGLADVVGALPKCIDREYYDVRVILPKYVCMTQAMKDRLTYRTHFYMDFHWQNQYVGIMESEVDGIKFYFIDNEFYFNGFKPYCDNALFEIEKFAFFSKAALSILPVIDFRPDLIHCHDWQTGLVPVYLHERFQGSDFYRGIKTVMTIHNLKFQGKWSIKEVQDITGLPMSFFTPDKLEAYKDANLLKGGLVYADAITTVSNTYAEEIKTPFYGEGLDGLKFFAAYDAGEPEAAEALAAFGEMTAAGIYAIQSMLDLERYAIGGGISARPEVTDIIRAKLDTIYESIHFTAFGKPEIVRCRYGNDANLIGALRFLLD